MTRIIIDEYFQSLEFKFTREPGATVDNEDKGVEQSVSRSAKGVRIRVLNAIMVVLAAAVSIIFLQAAHEASDTFDRFELATENYIRCESAATQMMDGSRYLTTQVRLFVVTQDLQYLDDYFWEVEDNQSREKAVDELESLQGGELVYLKQALADSVELMQTEYYAMKLVLEATGQDAERGKADLSGIVLSEQDAALSPQGKIERATALVVGDDYNTYVQRISDNVEKCKQALGSDIERVRWSNEETLHSLLSRQLVFTVMLLLVFIAMIVAIVVLVVWPLRAFSGHIQNNDPLPAIGAYELRGMADSYNVMYEENMKSHDALRRRAERDHLTGLYNRGVFERLLDVFANEHYVLLLVDTDYFKQVNDTYGHDTGDAILKKLSNLLMGVFRTTDYPCRIGGDEFAVVVTEMDENLKGVVESKAESLLAGMRDVSDGLPEVTLSMGIAFNDGTLNAEQIFKNADRALYDVKDAGRNGYKFYSE